MAPGVRRAPQPPAGSLMEALGAALDDAFTAWPNGPQVRARVAELIGVPVKQVEMDAESQFGGLGKVRVRIIAALGASLVELEIERPW